MTTWTSEELTKIGAADELRIAPRHHDGTLRKPVIVWVVRHGDALYVRSVNGRTAAWFRGTQVRHEGHIRAGGIEKDVTFAEVGRISTARSMLPASWTPHRLIRESRRRYEHAVQLG